MIINNSIYPYYSNYGTEFLRWDEDHGDIFKCLMGLDWLQATETRKEYFMSDISREYAYGSGDGIRTYKSKEYHPVVKNIQRYLNDIIPNCNFNVCFLNRYENERNHLGWHSDNSPELDQTNPIAVVSLGCDREIWWKPIGEKGEIPQKQRQLLEHGSLFIMWAGFQDLFVHKIPKNSSPCGCRISLTFRKWK